MTWNLPNKLTVMRAVMVPFFVAALLWKDGTVYGLRLLALALFCVASFTDYLDGHIARKYNLVTNFGKFMYPLADKLLVCSALICMVQLKMWGKSKTVSQMICIILLILNFTEGPLFLLTKIMIVVMTVLTVVSLIDYLAKNRKVLS